MVFLRGLGFSPMRWDNWTHSTDISQNQGAGSPGCNLRQSWLTAGMALNETEPHRSGDPLSSSHSLPREEVAVGATKSSTPVHLGHEKRVYLGPRILGTACDVTLCLCQTKLDSIDDTEFPFRLFK